MKRGDRVAKAAIEFESQDGILAGFHLVGFTVCDDEAKGLFVLFPASIRNGSLDSGPEGDKRSKTFFFLRPASNEILDRLETAILDVYEDMIGSKKAS